VTCRNVVWIPNLKCDHSDSDIESDHIIQFASLWRIERIFLQVLSNRKILSTDSNSLTYSIYSHFFPSEGTAANKADSYRGGRSSSRVSPSAGGGSTPKNGNGTESPTDRARDLEQKRQKAFEKQREKLRRKQAQYQDKKREQEQRGMWKYINNACAQYNADIENCDNMQMRKEKSEEEKRGINLK
jgi:hypothetical protein